MTKIQRPRVLIADDHVIVAEGLRKLLEPEYDMLDTVADGRHLVEAAMRLKPDVIVADVTMPILNGIEALRQILRHQPDIKVIFLSVNTGIDYVAEALRAGAYGYVFKRCKMYRSTLVGTSHGRSPDANARRMSDDEIGSSSVSSRTAAAPGGTS